jgi:uncharacterized protein (TIGR03083 family)
VTAGGWHSPDLELDPVRHEGGTVEIEDEDELAVTRDRGWMPPARPAAPARGAPGVAGAPPLPTIGRERPGTAGQNPHVSIDVWERVRAERLKLADEIETLSPEQWAMPSLCDRWRVADVAGHLVFLAEANQLRGTGYMWRYGRGFFPNRMIDATARRWAEAGSTELAGRLRTAVDGRYRFPGAPPAAALAEVVVHGEDIRRPLGLPSPERDPAAVVPLLNLYHRIGRWFLRRGSRDLRLEATDVDWAAGTGDLVRGPALAVLLALAGRPSACDDLEGDGVASLRQRSRGPAEAP